MSADRSARMPRSFWRGRPSTIRSPISAIRRVPMRHGIDLPHASLEQNRVSRRARSTTHARSSAMTTDPEPRWAPAVPQRLEVVGGVEQVRREQAPGRPADEQCLDLSAPRQLAGQGHDLAKRRGQRNLGDALGARSADLHEDRARAALAADRGERRGPVAHDPRDRGQRLHVLDDGRHVEQAALGGIRRTLLRLAALPLEGLQQDGLLAEHVGALDRPDA